MSLVGSPPLAQGYQFPLCCSETIRDRPHKTTRMTWIRTSHLKRERKKHNLIGFMVETRPARLTDTSDLPETTCHTLLTCITYLQLYLLTCAFLFTEIASWLK